MGRPGLALALALPLVLCFSAFTAQAHALNKLVTPFRPAPSTWRRTLCGTPSSVQPPIPEGNVESGRDYPGNDIPPCNVGGCPMAADATILDCKAKCAQASLCVGVVFAAGNCSGPSFAHSLPVRSFHTHGQLGSSGVVATMPFAWRGYTHKNSPTTLTRAKRSP